MNLVYSFIGKIPDYTYESFYQARLFFDGPIYFIINDYDSDILHKLKDLNITIVKYEDVIFDLLLEYFTKFPYLPNLHGRQELFFRSFERFFLLENLIIKYKLENVLFIEIDNLIYMDPTKYIKQLSEKDVAYMWDNKDRCSSGIFFVKNDLYLNKLNRFFYNWINEPHDLYQEMIALHDYYVKYPENVQLLPTMWLDNNYTDSNELSNTYSNYNSVFDSLPLGIYLFGQDTYHTDGKVKRKEQYECSSIKPYKYEYKWEKDEKGRNIPYILNNFTNTWIQINNLHIHSKDLKSALSI